MRSGDSGAGESESDHPMTSLADFLAALERLDVRIAADGDKLRIDAPKEAMTPELRAALAARKVELLAHLRGARAPVGGDAAGAQPQRDWLKRVSPGQRRILSLVKLKGASSVYNVPTAFELAGPLDAKALEQGLAEVERRHEALRTVFVENEGRHFQRVLPPRPATLQVVDLAAAVEALTPEARERAVLERVQDEVRRPFDLENGPVWRALLARTGPDRHVLVLTMHHIAFDGRSKPIFLRETGEAYASLRAGAAPAWPALPAQYVDFARWQRQTANDAHAEKRLAYWKRQLGGSLAGLELPADRARPAAPARGARSATFSVPGDTAKALRALARQEQSSLYIVLLAAYCALLAGRTGQEDLLVCSPFASRDRAEFEPLIGYLNTIVALRVDASGNPPFRELVARVRRVAFEAFEHQQVPLQRLVELPELARVPLSHAMFSYQDASSRTLDLAGVASTPIEVRKDASDFDLALYAESARDGGLGGILEYNADLFDDATIERIVGDYARLLDAVAADPDRELDGLPRSGPDRREVEARLGAHPQIDRAVVVRRPGHAGLVAYLVLNENDVPRLEDLRAFLRAAFPDYLVPASLVTVDRMPLAADGSVDVDALPPPPSGRRPGHDFVAPRTPLERRLAQVWKRVLWLDEDVSVDDSFADLGGHSLLSAQLVVELEAELGHELPTRALARLSTVADMARILEEAEEGRAAAEDEARALRPSAFLPEGVLHDLRTYTASWAGERASPGALVVGLNAAGALPPLFWCLQRYQELTQLARYLGNDQPVWGMRNGHKVMDRTEENVALLASHYVDEILDVRPSGPYLVGGNCGASRVAFQVARQLADRGCEVSLLFMHEKFIPQSYGGRVALVFGRESDRNPYLHFARPEKGWSKYYTGPVTFDFVRGSHAEFFVEPNVQVLTDTIRRRLAEARAGGTPEGLLPAAPGPTQRLPDEAYRARLAPRGSWRAPAASRVTVEVAVTNASPVAWEPCERSGIALVARWFGAGGAAIAWLDGWTPLAAGLRPGDTAELAIDVQVPTEPGTADLAFDLVDEGVTSFAAKGSRGASVPFAIDEARRADADYNAAPSQGIASG